MNNQVHVTVRQGILCGMFITDYTGDGKFIAFRRIPYAKPPIGELRFKDPVPAEPWTGVRDAWRLGHVAPQYDFFKKRAVGNEDCLYLDVYTKKVDSQTKRPVMLLIEGGSFHCCSGSSISYEPDLIVAKDVVLVTINFRLGVFGFLNLDNELAPGNQGLKDAVMALQWVHDNISNFGGDPENVTIFGQGFGGSIVHILAVCPQADGLFHKAISQSGTAAITLAFSEKETQEASSYLLVDSLFESNEEISNPNDILRHLRLVDTKDIVEASLELATTNDYEYKKTSFCNIRQVERLFKYPFVPTADCDSPNPFFVEHPKVLLRRGVKVPFIIGFTSHEGSVFVGESDTSDIADYNFTSIIHPSLWPTLQQRSITAADVYSRYFGTEPVSKKNIVNYVNLIGDMHFYFGIFETICIQAQLGHRSTYLYTFSHFSKRSLSKMLMYIYCPGAAHGEELPYLFYTRMSKYLRDKLDFQARVDPEKVVISDQITQMWTDFAKTGNPTPAITSLIPIKWTPLEKEDEFNFLIIDEDFRIKITQKNELRFFELL